LAAGSIRKRAKPLFRNPAFHLSACKQFRLALCHDRHGGIEQTGTAALEWPLEKI